MTAPVPMPNPATVEVDPGPPPFLPPFVDLPDNGAMIRLKQLKAWVVWRWTWNADRASWDKPPRYARTGVKCDGYNPKNLVTYKIAAKFAREHEGFGVGVSLQPDDDLTGIDLDHVLDPVTGKPLEQWVVDILEFGETYCEISPSGTGLRLLADGKIEEGFKKDKASVEVYIKSRYLTITGQHVEGTPTEILPAPKTIIRCRERVVDFEAADAKAKAEAEIAEAVTSALAISHADGPNAFEIFAGEMAKSHGKFGKEYWDNVNTAALAGLSRWVPEAFPGAKFYADKSTYRVTSKRLGRKLEEDLSFHRDGIQDFGEERGKTAIGVLVEHGFRADVVDAAEWLIDRLGVTRASMGWREATRASNAPAGLLSSIGAAVPATGGEKKEDEAPTLSHMGILVHARRDRLDLAPDIEKAGVFPVQHLPPILRDMVEAVHRHVQAPLSLCAHSVLSVCSLVAQPLADIYVPIVGDRKPLSLFMLAVAISGERKSSCDNLVSRAIRAHEDAMVEQSATKRQAYEAARHNHAADIKKLTNNKEIESADRLAALLALVEPVEPRPDILRASEPTLEGLINILKKGRPSVGIFSSEGGSFIGGHGMSDDSKVRTLTGLSKLWDDGSFDRVRANETVSIRGKRVAVSLAVQPRIAATLLGDDIARSQGFIGRFLICFPESTIGLREIRIADPDGDPRVAAFDSRVAAHLVEGEKVENSVRPPVLYLTDAADAVHRAMAQSIERELTKEGMLFQIQPLAQRMAEHIARIAGVLHVFEHGDVALPVSGATMSTACEIGSFYLNEALRIGDGCVIDPDVQDAKDLQVWIETRPGDYISPSIVQQKAPRSIRANAQKTRDMIGKLCAAGVLEIATARSIDGKPYREVYRIIRGRAA